MNGNLESNGPCLLGNAPKITIPSPENIPGEGDDMSDNLPSIKIYDDDVKIKFLICGPPCPLVSSMISNYQFRCKKKDLYSLIHNSLVFFSQLAGCTLIRFYRRWSECPLKHRSK